jgi:hypothetical protein
MQVDPASEGDYKNKTFLLNLFTYNNGTYFKVRSSAIYTKAPMFSFSDRRPFGKTIRQSLLVSYPMFTKYTGLASIKDIKYERMVFKLKPEFASSDQQ